MARNIHITITGELEKLVEQLIRQGLTEQEIMEKAFTLLKMAQKSHLAQVDERGELVGTLKVQE